MMKRLIPVVVLGAVAFLSGLAPAVAGVREDVAQQIERKRKGESKGLKDLLKAPLSEVVTEFRKYANDPDDRIRMYVTDTTTFLAVKSSDRAARRQAAQLVLEVSASDPDLGLASRASGKLATFSSADFTPQMRKVIYGFLQRPIVFSEDILLVGVAEVRAAEPKLRERAAKGDWAAHLALARMGDEAEILHVVSEVENEKDAVKKIMRASSLGYIRQPEGVEVLVRWLFRNDFMFPGEGDIMPTEYASTAMLLLAPIVENGPDFPGSYGVYGIDEINQMREWIAKKGVANLKIKR